jgi:hypothetical protein
VSGLGQVLEVDADHRLAEVATDFGDDVLVAEVISPAVSGSPSPSLRACEREPSRSHRRRHRRPRRRRPGGAAWRRRGVRGLGHHRVGTAPPRTCHRPDEGGAGVAGRGAPLAHIWLRRGSETARFAGASSIVLGVTAQVRGTFACEREPSRNIACGIRLTVPFTARFEQLPLPTPHRVLRSLPDHGHRHRAVAG